MGPRRPDKADARTLKRKKVVWVWVSVRCRCLWSVVGGRWSVVAGRWSVYDDDDEDEMEGRVVLR
jgi:hypothetical protein